MDSVDELTDRELDRAVDEEVFGRQVEYIHGATPDSPFATSAGWYNETGPVPYHSGSPQAAWKVVGRLGLEQFTVQAGGTESTAIAWVGSNKVEAKGGTPAVAICRATIKVARLGPSNP